MHKASFLLALIIVLVVAMHFDVSPSTGSQDYRIKQSKLIDMSGKTRFFYCIVGDNRGGIAHSDLNTAENDAQDLHDLIGQYPTHPGTINMLLLGKNGYTVDWIRDFFQDAKEAARAGDEIVFYYSGHGGREESKYPSPIEQDTMSGIIAPAAGALYDEDLRMLCEGFDTCVTINIIIDACYSGEFYDDPSDFMSELDGAHAFVIASCEKDKTSPSEYYWPLDWLRLSYTYKRLLPALTPGPNGKPKADLNRDGILQPYEFFMYSMFDGPLFLGDDDGDGEEDEDDVEHNDSTGTHEHIDNDGDTWIDEDPGQRNPGYFDECDLLCSAEGEPAFFTLESPLPPSVSATSSADDTLMYAVWPRNFGFASSSCTETDTFCVVAHDTLGWEIRGDPPFGQPHILGPGDYFEQEIIVEIPCEASIGDLNLIVTVMTYTDMDGICAPCCGDCEDPVWYEGNPYYSTDSMIIELVEPIPFIEIFNDSLSTVDQGVEAGYVPFTICNADFCSPPSRSYGFRIWSMGTIGEAIDTSGTVSDVLGGDCIDVHAVMNASDAMVGDTDNLTMTVWSLSHPTLYESSVQIVEVVEPEVVPVMRIRIMLLLVIALMMIAAVALKKRLIGQS